MNCSNNLVPAVLEHAPTALQLGGARMLYRPDVLKTDSAELELTSGVSLLYAVRRALRENGCRIPLKRLEIYSAPNLRGPLAKVPRAEWGSRLIKHGEFIQVVAPVHGGGKKKNPINTILTLVVVAAAAAVSYGIGSTLAASFTAGMTEGTLAFSMAAGMGYGIGALAGGAIMIGGMLLVNTIAPHPTPKLSMPDNLTPEKVWSISGTQNKALLYQMLPLILGKVRYAPVYAANPYTVLKGKLRYGRYLFAVAGRNKVSDLRIGDTALDTFKGVTFNVHENWRGQNLKLFPSAVYEENVATLLKGDGKFIQRTGVKDAVELNFELYFGSGLVHISGKGKKYETTVELTTEYRKVGDRNWLPAFGTKQVKGGTVYVAGKVFPFRPIRSGNYVVYQNAKGELSVSDGTIKNSEGDSGLNALIRGSYKVKKESVSVTAERCPGANIEYSISGGSVTILPGTVKCNRILVTEASVTPFWRGYSIKTDPGEYEIRIMRNTPDSDPEIISSTTRDEVTWSVLRSFRHGKPLAYTGAPLTLIELEIQASEQLNGHVQELNAQFESYCPTWNGRAWVEAPSSNPAALGMLLATAPHIRKRADLKNPYKGVDLPAWQGFYEWCQKMGWSYNAVQTSQETVRDVLHNVLASARAAIAFNNAQYSVVWDHPDKVTRYPIGPRNSWGFRATKYFAKEEVHALRARFLNARRDYQEDERIVYNDGYNANNAVNIVESEFDGVTDPDLIYKLARLRLADSIWRPEIYELNMDFAFLAFNKGDRVEVTHDTPIWGLRQARIMDLIHADYDFEDMSRNELIALAVENQRLLDPGFGTPAQKSLAEFASEMAALADGEIIDRLEACQVKDTSLVTGLLLDDHVSMENGKLYALKYFPCGVQSLSYSLETDPVTTNLVRLATPLPSSSAPLPDGLVHFGEAGRETHDCIVTGIDTQDNLCARITLQDYSVEQIYKSLTEAIPEWDSDISLPSRWQLGKPAAPLLTSIKTDESVLLRAQNSFIPRIQAGFLLPQREGVEVAEVRIQVRRKDSGAEWVEAGRAAPASGCVYAEGVEEGEEYEIRLFALSSSGVASDFSVPQSALIIGRTTPPPAPLAVHLEGSRLWWDMPADTPMDVRGWEVWMVVDEYVPFAQAQLLTNPATPVAEFDLGNWGAWAKRVWVRSIDDIGLVSDPVSVGVNLGGAMVYNVVAELREREQRNWPGQVVDGYISNSKTIYPYSSLTFWEQPQCWQAGSFWGSDFTLSMFYTTTCIIPDGYRQSWLSLQPELPFGGLAGVEYRLGHGQPFWQRSVFAPKEKFWAWQAVSEWHPMPSKLRVEAEQIIQARLRTAQGSPGVLEELVWVFDVEDEIERVDNLEIPPAGLRVPLLKAFRWIDNLVFGLEYREGSGAINVVWLDKGLVEDGRVTAGPYIQCRDINNLPVAGVVDVTLQGAKGVV